MENLSIRIPRCEVCWGEEILTTKALTRTETLDNSIVYGANVSLQESGQTPSGSMSWDPTGAGFREYEGYLTRDIDNTITVRFFYLGGRSITFSFVWSGHTENYGTNMSLEVKLASQVDGLINANIKSTAKTDEKGKSVPGVIGEISKSYGVDDIAKVVLTRQVQDYLGSKDAPLVKSSYSEGTTWAETVRSIAEEVGTLVLFPGIRNPADPDFSPFTAVLFGPYKTDTYEIEELSLTSDYPDPTIRYGYFLGPGIINSLQKTSEWQPPQRTQTPLDNSQEKKDIPNENSSTGAQPKETATQRAARLARENAKEAPGASGSGRRGRAGSRIEKNEKGERNKKALQEERAAKLSATVFACPALMGIKPNDILFVPSYKGDFVEDWIVTSVEYSQTDGGVEISIQASREYGLGNLMNPTLGEPWKVKAFTRGLVGENSSLENWISYAWNLPPPNYPLPESANLNPPAAALSETSSASDSYYYSLPPHKRALLDTIRFAEGTDKQGRERSGGILFGGAYFAPLGEGGMTVREVIQMGNTRLYQGKRVPYGTSYNSSATGAYQIMPDTLNSLVTTGKISLNQKFTLAAQDQAALNLAERRRGEGFTFERLEREGFSQGISTSLSREWASFPRATGVSAYGQPVKRLSELQAVYNESLRRNSALQSASSTPGSVLPPSPGPQRQPSLPVNTALLPQRVILDDPSSRAPQEAIIPPARTSPALPPPSPAPASRQVEPALPNPTTPLSGPKYPITDLVGNSAARVSLTEVVIGGRTGTRIEGNPSFYNHLVGNLQLTTIGNGVVGISKETAEDIFRGLTTRTRR